MKSRLEPILLKKKSEIADLYQRLNNDKNHPVMKMLYGNKHANHLFRFKNALKSSGLSVIAEIKRKSPSKGIIAPISDPVHLAQRYILGGASALSVLTDQEFFNGHLDDIAQISKEIKERTIPILRKDFIIDPIQIAEAAVAGASAILCIISAVGHKAKELIEFAHSVGMDVLVEIHDSEELQIALDCGADIIGINNRNLKTFEVDTTTALKIISAIPSHIVKVAESGITNPALARQYDEAGFDAVLIGEALVTSNDPEQFIKNCRLL